MDFELSADQQLMRSGLRELLDRACDVSHVRAVAYDGDPAGVGALWRALADAGWTGVAVPKTDGGAGLRFEDVVLVLEEGGRSVLPAPLTTTLLAARTIARAPEGATRSDLLGRIVRGDASVTLALAGAHREGPEITAERASDGWQLSGACRFVPYGPNTHIVLTEAKTPSGRAMFALPASEASWTDLHTMDLTAPLFEMTLDGATVPAEAANFGETDAGPEVERLRDEWRAALAAETLGACDRAVEMAVAYAKDRTQFDRPIGQNQAVKARIADMGAAVERMRAAVYHAAVKIDAGAPDRALAVAMAKAATATPGAWVGSQAIHVHGGIGYTWEHNIHLFFKRIKANELLLGDGMASLARVADAVL